MSYSKYAFLVPFPLPPPVPPPPSPSSPRTKKLLVPQTISLSIVFNMADSMNHVKSAFEPDDITMPLYDSVSPNQD